MADHWSVWSVPARPGARRCFRTSCGTYGSAEPDAAGLAPAFDSVDYRGRDVIQRRFNLLKQWRGVATRHDKLAIVYRSVAVLHAVVTWTKALSDTP